MKNKEIDKKIEVKNVMVADKAIISDDGKISLINIFNKINLCKDSCYVAVLPFAIYGILKRKEEGLPKREFKLTVNVNSPTNKIIGSPVIINMKFSKGRDIVKFIANYGAMIFTEEGKYKLELVFNKTPLKPLENIFNAIKKT